MPQRCQPLPASDAPEVAEALKEVSGHHYFGLPKHERLRSVSLPPFLVEVLRRHIEAFPPINDLLFTSPEGALLRRSHFERRTWTPAVERVGLDPGLTFHGLRHTAVSILQKGGIAVDASFSTARDRYALRDMGFGPRATAA